MIGKLTGVLLALALLASCASEPRIPPPSGSRAGMGDSTGGAERIGFARGGDPLADGADRIYFDVDRAVIRDDARAILDQQAEWLNRDQGATAQIAGNCDERGTTEYNLALGNRRAYAAYTYLMAKGVPAGRMSTISYGKDRPIAPGSSEADWARNRNAITSAR